MRLEDVNKELESMLCFPRHSKYKELIIKPLIDGYIKLLIAHGELVIERVQSKIDRTEWDDYLRLDGAMCPMSQYWALRAEAKELVQP
jgi:hypothetical protein